MAATEKEQQQIAALREVFAGSCLIIDAPMT